MLDRMIESMREFQRAFGRSAAAAGGQIVELPGVVGCLTPGLASYSLFNAAIYESSTGLDAVLPELERRYASAGVGAWGVWAPDADAEAAAALQRHGMKLDSAPVAMSREIGESIEAPAGLNIARADDLGAVDRVEAAAWGMPAGQIAAAMPGLLDEFNCYLARTEAGEPAAVVGTVHHHGDCGVTLVGTAPAARGRGLATAAMLHALAEAVRAGCTTTTLQATAAGRPIYVRLGYREHGTMNLWEKRR